MSPDPAEDGAPADPLTGLAEGAVTLHAFFESYKTAGFSESQAFEITRTILREQIRKTGGGE